jgi:hypothetical protein
LVLPELEERELAQQAQEAEQTVPVSVAVHIEERLVPVSVAVHIEERPVPVLP